LTPVESISLPEAQFLVLRRQRLVPSTQGRSKEDVVDVVKSLCGVQYDPLPVIAQAHYITLWNRVQGFKENWLDSLLYEERKLIEFMLMRQTLNIVPTEELPYYYQGTRSVVRAGWIKSVIDKKESETSREILQKMREKGELSPKDFHYAAFRPLFYSGEIFIARREKGVFRMPYYRLFLILPRCQIGINRRNDGTQILGAQSLIRLWRILIETPFIIKDIVFNRELENNEWKRVLKKIEEFANFHNANKIKVTKTESVQSSKGAAKTRFIQGEEKGCYSL